MKSKNIKKMLVLLTSSMLITSLLAGCQSSSKNSDGNKSGTSNDPLKITVFDDAANYQGDQTGWFAKVIEKKFNISLNILAPNVAGASLYQTRAAAGNLGDLLVISNNELSDSIKAGLVMDMSSMIDKYPNLKKYYDQFSYFNKTFDKDANPKGLIYGLPTNTVATSPTSYTAQIPYSSPMLPWDYYVKAGSPKMNNLNDLLNVLKTMQQANPKAPNGKPTYAISLWKDWDNYMMENVRWLCNWYGYEEPADTSTVMVNAAGQPQVITDDNSMYYQILKFFYTANQMGLVDPDSVSQDWNTMSQKLTNKQVLLLWYSWENGFYNTIERGKNNDGYVGVPIADTKIIQDGDAYYGDGRVFAIGSQAKEPERIMQFLDWMASPEGVRYIADGIEGFNYTKQADGKFAYTEAGQTAFQNNTPVPAELGGGGYQDGQSKINTQLINDMSPDPDTKETFNPNLWSSTIKLNQTTLTNNWQKAYDAKDALDYYMKNKMIDVVPNINVNFGTDTSEITNSRNQCKQLVLDTSWRMVFAKNETEFNKLWNDMKTQLKGLGWDELVTTDKGRVKVLADLRAQAVSNKK